MRAALLAAAAAGAAAQAPVDPKIYGRAAATELGCVCKSACGTSALFGCFSQAWCTVQDQKCAKGDAPHSLAHGYYDYCVYPAYAPYESRSAAQKAALIAQRLAANASSGAYPSGLSLAGIFSESVTESYNSTSDVFTEPNRVKYIHSVGTVAPVRFVRTGGSYTGLFQGADHGLVRLSSANAPSDSGFTPGAAVKLFRDGTASANFMAMPSLDAQPCNVSDFFARDFTNHVDGGSALALQVITHKFWQASFCPKMVGLSDLAAIDQKGAAVTPVFPYHLVLSAGKGAAATMPCADYAEGLANIAAIPTGTHLFEVNAQAAPGAAYEHIGYFELTGGFTTSNFGDRSLFFKHQYMEEDFAARPEWLAAIDKKQACGMNCAGTVPPTHEQGCSSPFDPPPPPAAKARAPCPYARMHGEGVPCPH